MESNLSKEAFNTVNKIEHYERNWHIFKAIILTIGLTIIVIVQLYTYNRLLDNSDKNRILVRCTITALVNPQQTADKFRSDLNNCLDKTK